jgi:fucose permease
MKTRLDYILTAYLGLFCYGLIDNSRGPAFPSILDSLNLTNSQGSWIFACSTMSSLIPILLSSRWLKAIGPMIGQQLSFVFLAAGIFLAGLSPALPGAFAVLIAASFIFGLGMGASSVAANILVAHGSPEPLRRRLFCGVHSMYGISSVIAPLLYSLSARVGLSWSILFMLLAAPPILTLAGSMFVKRRSDYDYSHPESSEIPLFKKLRVGIMMATYVGAEITISSRLVLFVTRTSKTSPADASLYLSLFFLLLLAGRLLFAVIPFRTSSFKLLLMSASSSLLLFIAGIAVDPIFMSLCGFTMSYFFPCGMDWISKEFGSAKDYMMAFVVASFTIVLVIMHWSVGLVSDLLGMRAAMCIGPAFLVICLLMMGDERPLFISFLGRRTSPR